MERSNARLKVYNHTATWQRSMVERSGRPQARERRQELEEVLTRIVSVLEERYHPKNVILFGSHAYGTPNDDSDIDLLIIKETDRPFDERYAEVSGLIRDVRHGWAVSTFVVTPAELEKRMASGDQFITEVLSRGRWLYGPERVQAAR